MGPIGRPCQIGRFGHVQSKARGATLLYMTNQAISSDIRRYALAGAQARLTEMAQEVEAIRRAFPELRESRGPRRRGKVAEQDSTQDESSTATKGRRRHTMTAAQRKAVGERMRKYWAAKRGGSQASASSDSPETAPAPAARATKAGATAKRRPRNMSPEARKRISEAQKTRWAAHRRGGQATGASESKAGTSGTRKARSVKDRPRAAKPGPRKVSATARKRMSQAQKKRWAAKRAAQ